MEGSGPWAWSEGLPYLDIDPECLVGFAQTDRVEPPGVKSQANGAPPPNLGVIIGSHETGETE